MKKYLLLLSLFLAINAQAQQRQAAYWLFGGTFAIDFNEPTLRVQQLSRYLPFGSYPNGWATMCDKNGNFLFGVNNSRIVDKNLKIMKGGYPLTNRREMTNYGNNLLFWLPMTIERGNGMY